jgi:hypothetical protein
MAGLDPGTIPTSAAAGAARRRRAARARAAVRVMGIS